MFTNYADVCHYLHTKGLFHMDLSLARIKDALRELHLTHPSFVVVQVVGTNGKGSTSTFLESLARAHGLRTGLFTSPHFVTPSERIHVDGHPLPHEHWPELAQQVYHAAPNLTYFEFLTVLSFLAFSKAKIDIAIMEAGLGGHYDATTALTRHALCITPISLDHESILGATVLAIATDKAHAMGENMPVFLGEQEPSVKDFLYTFAKKRKAHIYPTQKELLLPQQKLGLQGSHQKENALLALTAWKHLAKQYAWPCESSNRQKGLAQAFIAGRLQHIHSEEKELPQHLLLDGAHNAHGLERLLNYVESLAQKPVAIIFSCLADKDTQGMLPLLKKLHLACHHCPLYLTDIQHNDRALNPEEKLSLLQELGNSSKNASSLEATLALARTELTINTSQGPVLLCGSLYLLGEFFEKYPHYLLKNA